MAQPKESYRIREPLASDWKSAIRELVRQINIEHQRMAEAFSEAFVFGGIGCEANDTATVISASATKYQFLNFDTNFPSNGMSPDYTQGHILVESPGVYLIFSSLTIESPGGGGFTGEFEVFKNDGATELPLIHVDRDFAGGGGESGSCSLSGFADLLAGDTLELWVENETSTANMTLEDVTLCAVKVSNNA